MLYAGMKVDKYKTKIINFQHGGEYGTTKIDWADKHEINISDSFLTWGWKSNDSKKIFPFGIIRPLNLIKKINRKNSKKILLVLRSSTKFHRLSSTLCGP